MLALTLHAKYEAADLILHVRCYLIATYIQQCMALIDDVCTHRPLGNRVEAFNTSFHQNLKSSWLHIYMVMLHINQSRFSAIPSGRS